MFRKNEYLYNISNREPTLNLSSVSDKKFHLQGVILFQVISFLFLIAF